MTQNTPCPVHTMEQLLAQLENPLPHPDADSLRRYSDEVAHWCQQHFSSLPEQALGATGSRADLERLLREPPPEEGSDFTRVLHEFTAKVVPHTIRVDHPRFLAFIPGAPSYFSILGDWLTAALNCFAGVWLEAAGPSQVELLVLDWFKEFLGYPQEAQGILTGGGSEANLTALAVARESLSFAERGRALLYQSDQRHYSLDKAAKILGLRPDQIRLLPTGDDFRFRAGSLARAVAEDRGRGNLPWVVVANAGATNTGQVDPLNELAACCRENKLWLHVDAAYGWAAALTEEGKYLLRGIEQADSITLDPHKWFAQTFDVGCVFVRQGRLLFETFRNQAEYMQDVAATGAEINFADLGPALTRRFRALKIWLSLKVLGVGWFRALVERGLRLAELLEALLRQNDQFELLGSRGLSVVCFRCRPKGLRFKDEKDLDHLNLGVAEEVRKGGRFFLASTILRGHVVLRCCFVNWRTTAADVVELVELLSTVQRQLSEVENEITRESK